MTVYNFLPPQIFEKASKTCPGEEAVLGHVSFGRKATDERNSQKLIYMSQKKIGKL
jgi:hypothetical protein